MKTCVYGVSLKGLNSSFGVRFCWLVYRGLLVMATHKILAQVMNDPKNKQTFKKFKIEAFREMDVQSTNRKLPYLFSYKPSDFYTNPH